MHVEPPPSPPHVRSRRKEHAPRGSSPLWSLLWVPEILCVCVVYKLVGLHAFEGGCVKVQGANAVCVLLCVQR